MKLTRRRALAGLVGTGVLTAAASAADNGPTVFGIGGGDMADEAIDLRIKYYVGTFDERPDPGVINRVYEVKEDDETHPEHGAIYHDDGESWILSDRKHRHLESQSYSTEGLDTGARSEEDFGRDNGIPPAVQPRIFAVEHRAEPYRTVEYQDGAELYAVLMDQTADNDTIHKSTNNGESWSEQGSVGEEVVTGGLLKIQDTGTLIAIDDNGSVHRSTDDGSSWTEEEPNLVVGILGPNSATETPNGDILIAEYEASGNHNHNIYRSTDDGQSFSSVFEVNSSTSDVSDPDGSHIHNVQYDPHRERFVAGHHQGIGLGDHGVIVSDGKAGSSWEEIGINASEHDPFFVSVMFFENYIAWGTDRHESDDMGRINRLDAGDFYSASWGDNVQHVANIEDRVFYFAQRATEDTWLLSVAHGDDSGPATDTGPPSQQLYPVTDGGSVVGHGIEYWRYNQELDAQTGVNRITPASIGPEDTAAHAGGVCWTNIFNAGQPSGSQDAGLPVMVGRKRGMQTISTATPNNIWIPKGGEIRAWDLDKGSKSSPNDSPIVETSPDNDDVNFVNPYSDPRGEVHIQDDGQIRFRIDGNEKLRVDENRVFVPSGQRLDLFGQVLEGIKEYDNASPGNLRTEELAIDENRGGSGNRAIIYKDTGGALHYIDFDGTI